MLQSALAASTIPKLSINDGQIPSLSVPPQPPPIQLRQNNKQPPERTILLREKCNTSKSSGNKLLPSAPIETSFDSCYFATQISSNITSSTTENSVCEKRDDCHEIIKINRNYNNYNYCFNNSNNRSNFKLNNEEQSTTKLNSSVELFGCGTNLNNFNNDQLVNYNKLQQTNIICNEFERYNNNLIGSSDNKTFLVPSVTSTQKQITLVKNSGAVIFTRKDPIPIVHQSTPVRLRDKRRSLQFISGTGGHLSNLRQHGDNRYRKQQSFSWYAPVYTALEEEDIEKELKEAPSLYRDNLAYNKKQQSHGLCESASLLETTTATQPAQIHQPRSRKTVQTIRPTTLPIHSEGPHAPSLGGPTSKCRKFEQLFKTLVGRKSSPSTKEIITPTTITQTNPHPMTKRLPSPEILITRTPSEHNLIKHDKISNSSVSLNSVQQKLWSVVPLLRREGSSASLHHTKPSPLPERSGMKKCETVLALSRSSSNLEPIRPQNRLRHCASVATCSRCSSLLSLAAANSSRYSLNLSNGGFVTVGSNAEKNHGASALNTPNNFLQPINNVTHNSLCNLKTTIPPLLLSKQTSTIPPSPVTPLTPPNITSICKLCLGEVVSDRFTKITQCGCSFCSECMSAYVEFEIMEGAYEISCPDALCPAQGILTLDEIMVLSSTSLMDKHQRYRLNREVELDKNRTWCPKAGCETVCLVGDKLATQQTNTILMIAPCAVQCPTCAEEFCSGCKKSWHPTMSCEENTKRLAADGQGDNMGIPFDNDLIKCCPMCAVPIEKDEGCAQMMCKRCKHVFCWYCLASLDDDFLLRHYDKGPCKNKLGHSRASVVWHRAQVIGIFAGFGILLLVASPLLLLAAPCIVCCKCRICSGAAKLEENEADFEEGSALQR